MEHTSHAVHAGDEHPHPGPRTYVEIAVVLAIITIVEVAILYLPDFEGWEWVGAYLLPSFLILSAIKFALVVMFYMHLKFDSRIFTGIFAFFLLIALSVAVAFIALFHGFHFL